MGISFTKDAFAKLESMRGDVSRSRYIVKLVEKNFQKDQDKAASIKPEDDQ